MKIITLFCVSVLIATAIVGVLPIDNEEAVYTDMVRLHVLANSDSEEDQALKLKVRDRILAVVSEDLSGIYDANEAKGIIEASREKIEAAAVETIVENGYNYNVQAELTKEVYPEREYEGFTLPSGEYYSFKVKIGEAKGKNWWCVLFPPMCTTAATERNDVFIAAGFTEEQYRYVTETEGARYKIKFKIVEIIESIIREKNSKK